MAGRERAVPLATLVCIVGVLVALRVRESSRERRALAGATRVASALVDGGPAPGAIARATTAAERLLPAASAPHMLHGDPRHTGRARALGPHEPRVVWTSAIGAPIEAQVVTSPDERTLYVASLDGSLTALDVKDGSRTWRLALGDRAYGTPCVSTDSPALIYVGSDAKRFYAVTPEGTIAWRLEVNGEADTSAVLTPDKLVVFAAGPSLYAVRQGTGGGDVAWRFDAKKKIFSSPALAPDGTLVFGAQDHDVYAVTPKGQLAWSTDLGADVDATPVIADDGAILVGTDAGEVVRLSSAGGVVWRTQVGGYVRGALSLARNGDLLAGVYGPTPRVVRVTPDGAVRASFPIRGTGAREFGVHGAPLEDASGALFFGGQDDEVHAVGPLLGPDGAWQWTYITGGDVDAPLTLLSSGALVVAGDDGNVVLLSP